MRLKKKILYVCLLLLLCLPLASCAGEEAMEQISQQWHLLKEEYEEIGQFFDRKFTPAREQGVYIVQALSDSEAAPVVDTLAHTEIIPSPYNSGLWTMFDVGNGEDSAVRTKEGYTHIPALTNREAQAVYDLFGGIGAQVQIELRSNPAPAGQVFAIRYGGFSDDSGYYVNPIVPVTLYVSDKKAITPQEGLGHNVVYLTYDDGPTKTDTLRLLDILDTYGVKATFFTTGESVKKYPSSAKAIADRGHTLACHSVTHQYEKIYASTEALKKEVLEWEQIVSDAGVSLNKRLFRYPGGSVGKYFSDEMAEDMTAMLEDRGYTVFDWNVVTNDSLLYMAEDGTDTYEYIRQNFKETLDLCLRENNKKENAPIIILMHETVPETVDLMPWMLEYLMEQGFVFGDLSTCEDSWTFADR